jgi:hypothetical protein
VLLDDEDSAASEGPDGDGSGTGGTSSRSERLSNQVSRRSLTATSQARQVPYAAAGTGGSPASSVSPHLTRLGSQWRTRGGRGGGGSRLSEDDRESLSLMRTAADAMMLIISDVSCMASAKYVGAG